VLVQGHTAESLALPVHANRAPVLSHKHEIGLPLVCHDSVTSQWLCPTAS